MLKKQEILLDIDNCLNDLTRQLLVLYNRDSGDNLTLNDITDYKIDGFVKPEWANKIESYFDKSDVWKMVSPIANSQYFVDRLIKDGHKIMITTATSPRNFWKKSGWLERNYPTLDLGLAICAKEKNRIMADILIDDCAEYFTANNRVYKGICFDYNAEYAWNHKLNINDVDMFRTYNWREIYECVVKIAGGV